MIAYALLRIAARAHRIGMSILRFTDLAHCLLERSPAQEGVGELISSSDSDSGVFVTFRCSVP